MSWDHVKKISEKAENWSPEVQGCNALVDLDHLSAPFNSTVSWMLKLFYAAVLINMLTTNLFFINGFA